MTTETIITLALSTLALLGSGYSWLAGKERRKAQADAASIDNVTRLSDRLTELENEREGDYQERADLRRKMWKLEREHELLKRQNETLRRGVMLLVAQIRNEGLEPAWVPDEHKE